MNSLNNYYNFLKNNNIVNFNSLKDFITNDEYKLKIKEDNNLAIIFNDYNSILKHDIVRFFNGVIINKENLKVICYTFDKCLEENIIDQDILNKDIMVQPVFDGTLIRLFYFDNKWNLSTKKMINAYHAKWNSDKSFGEMFIDIFNINLNNEYDFLNKNYCYSFLMGHKENNILYLENNYLIHLNTIDLNSNIEIIDDLLLGQISNNIRHINNFNSYIINFDNDKMIEHINMIKNDMGLNEIGYIFMNKENFKRQKYIKNNFNEIKNLWGNTNNRLFRYLNLRKNPDVLKKYLDIFIHDKQLFLNFETYLMSIATHILNIYRNKHISKKEDKIPFYLRDIIYKTHGLYLQSKNKVSFQDINVLLHDLDEKKLCYIINNIEKDKKNSLEDNNNVIMNNQIDSNEVNI